MRRAQAYHPIETEAIIACIEQGLQWKVIARRIGRDVDRTSLRQHVRRVAPDILVIHRPLTQPKAACDVYREGRPNEMRMPT